MKEVGEDLLRKVSDIELYIDDYEYIFSDFDSRPYSQKLLSEDLLNEMKRANRDKGTKNVNLKFLVPKNKRDPKKEIIIKKRLKEFFKGKFSENNKNKKKILRQGISFFVLGIFFMVIATFFLVENTNNYLITFLAVLSEPAGWFLFWEGLNLLIFDMGKRTPNLKFYEKMSKSTIYFSDAQNL